MRQIAFSHALRRGMALALAIVLAVPNVYAAAGERKLQTTAELTEGLTYRNTVTVNNDSRVESFALELAGHSGAETVLIQGSGTIYGAATIQKAVEQGQSQGYHVLGAINTDFFSTASGVPIGIVIENGVYKSSPENEAAMTITGGKVQYVETPAVNLTLTNQRTGEVVTPHHLNKWRSPSGGMYLLNQDFSSISTRTSTSGWHVRMKVVERIGEYMSPLKVNGWIDLEVTELYHGDQPAVIGENEYILTSDDASGYSHIFESFQVGDRLTLETSCSDQTLSEAEWAGGVGDLMVRDGQLTDSSTWTYHQDGRAPRTALGVKADGTLLVYAVDGRRSSYSVGLTQMDLAEEMRDQGCQWAVNLDGGGSTAISVWLPGQSGPSVRNLPSDGRPRSCATYLLFVAREAGNGQADQLAMKENGLTVLAGSSVILPETVVLDDALNILDQELEDLAVTSQNGLGTIENGLYQAGLWPGTDILNLTAQNLGVKGTAQIHVVDHLTQLSVRRSGSSEEVNTLVVKPGETVQLSVTGSYWGRTALRDLAPVTMTVESNVGQIDERGLFTAAENGDNGVITISVGGLTRTIQVSKTNVHLDVTQDHWAYNAVEYCYQNGIVGGISATEFGRDAQIRRADFMLMLYNAAGKPASAGICDFNDVSPEDYYYQALAWGQEAGLASGTGNGAYSPTANVTREQAFTILRQAMPILGKICPTGSLTVLDQFSDKDQIADYAKGHTATLVAQGVVSGKGSGIDPKGNLTRAEMAALLHKLLTYTPILDVPPMPEQPGQPDEPVVPEQPGQPDEPVAPEQPIQPELPDPAGYQLTLDQEAVTLRAGDSVALNAALTPVWEGAEITWTCSDPDAAVVSPKGVVTNLFTGVGEASLTVTATWNGLSASCQVICQAAELTGTVIHAEKGLNVRSGPGTEHPVIGGLTDGVRVVVLKAEKGWCHVLYRNQAGQAALGYVSGEYIQLSH